MPDHRTKRQKLEDLANHPRTPKNEAAAARRALARDTQADTIHAHDVRYAQPDAGKRPAGRQTGPRVFVGGVDVTDRVPFDMFWKNNFGSGQDDEQARRRSPNSCPGCRHRSELHSEGICYSCKRYGQLPCDWHYEFAEVDMDGQVSWARERPYGWYRNE